MIANQTSFKSSTKRCRLSAAICSLPDTERPLRERVIWPVQITLLPPRTPKVINNYGIPPEECKTRQEPQRYCHIGMWNFLSHIWKMMAMKSTQQQVLYLLVFVFFFNLNLLLYNFIFIFMIE